MEIKDLTPPPPPQHAFSCGPSSCGSRPSWESNQLLENNPFFHSSDPPNQEKNVFFQCFGWFYAMFVYVSICNYVVHVPSVWGSLCCQKRRVFLNPAAPSHLLQDRDLLVMPGHQKHSLHPGTFEAWCHPLPYGQRDRILQLVAFLSAR